MKRYDLADEVLRLALCTSGRQYLPLDFLTDETIVCQSREDLHRSDKWSWRAHRHSTVYALAKSPA